MAQLSEEKRKALESLKSKLETKLTRLQNTLNETTAEYNYVRGELGLPPVSK